MWDIKHDIHCSNALREFDYFCHQKGLLCSLVIDKNIYLISSSKNKKEQLDLINNNNNFIWKAFYIKEEHWKKLKIEDEKQLHQGKMKCRNDAKNQRNQGNMIDEWLTTIEKGFIYFRIECIGCKEAFKVIVSPSFYSL